MTTHGHTPQAHKVENDRTKSAAPSTPAPSPQADGSPEPLHGRDTPDAEPGPPRPTSADDAGDKHIGATEDQVSDTTAPAGEAYSDEPRQG